MKFFRVGVDCHSPQNFTRLLLSGVFALGSLSVDAAFAAPPADGCTTIGCSGRIQDIYIDDTDEVYITPPVGNYQNLSCTLYGTQYFKLAPTHKKYKEIYGTMTAALIAQTKVHLRIFSDAGGFCSIKYVVAYSGG